MPRSIIKKSLLHATRPIAAAIYQLRNLLKPLQSPVANSTIKLVAAFNKKSPEKFFARQECDVAMW